MYEHDPMTPTLLSSDGTRIYQEFGMNLRPVIIHDKAGLEHPGQHSDGLRLCDRVQLEEQTHSTFLSSSAPALVLVLPELMADSWS